MVSRSYPAIVSWEYAHASWPAIRAALSRTPRGVRGWAGIVPHARGAWMNAWKSGAALLAAAVTALAAGCATSPGDATAAAALAGENPDITVAAIPSADLAGLYVALDDGLFARQGLHVTIKKIASTKAVIADQLSGQVDIGAGSYVGYISAQAGGARFRILAEASTLRPHTRVLLTAPGSRIESVGDLAGQKIGVNGTNSIGTLLISALFAENGISPAWADFVTDKQGFPVMGGQLQQGSWDAAFLAEPYATKAEEDYGQEELADLDQGAALNFPIDGYVATWAWTRTHPKAAAAFVRAAETGQAIAQDDPPAARAAMGKSDGLPPEMTVWGARSTQGL
jgi:NitT/TauT family transport system substrate-binding protein